MAKPEGLAKSARVRSNRQLASFGLPQVARNSLKNKVAVIFAVNFSYNLLISRAKVPPHRRCIRSCSVVSTRASSALPHCPPPSKNATQAPFARLRPMSHSALLRIAAREAVRYTLARARRRGRGQREGRPGVAASTLVEGSRRSRQRRSNNN